MPRVKFNEKPSEQKEVTIRIDSANNDDDRGLVRVGVIARNNCEDYEHQANATSE